MPDLPQLLFVVPDVQSPVLTSTHPLQLLQVPLSQVCLEPHGAHSLPPLPHCEVVVRVMHELPEQHPSGQVVALHEPGPASGFGIATQTPFELHSSVDPQAAHELPLLPQADFEVPPRHTPWPSRQPSQLPPTHRPAELQVAPAVQARQLYPCAPQADVDCPAWHEPALSMHPVQAAFWHRPPVVHC